MKALISCLLSGIFTLSSFAQKAPIKFGDVPLEDLKMTYYSKDSSASALILADFGESEITYNQANGFQLEFERITRIKILKKDGFEWADFSIPLYHSGSSDEKLFGLKAVTYNLENGKIVESKVKNDAVFKEKVNENVEIMKITWPNVKEGSVLEISYKVSSDFLFNFQDWEFQQTIPVVWSEYRAGIPEFFTYEKYMQGYVPLALNENTTKSNSITLSSTTRTGGGGFTPTTSTFNQNKIDFTQNLHRWVAKDVPAFKSEPFITTSKDYVSKINFELGYIKYPNQPVQPVMGTWADINKKYAEDSDFGGAVTGNGFLKKIVEEITSGLDKDEAKVTAIDAYVKKNVSWDGTTRKYLDSSLKKVLEEKKGSSAEINLLIASLLEKAGFKVSPVLISTRDNGFIRETTPVSSQFNAVVCLVEFGDKKILLDGTDALLPPGILPERCLNGSGFVISKNGFTWVSLAPRAKSRSIVNIDIKLSPDGELKGKVGAEQTGYYGHRVRKKFIVKGQEEYIKDFLGSRTWQISKSEFSNALEPGSPFKETHEVAISEHATVAGDVIYLNPFLLLREEENPFKLEKREYPVDFGSPIEKTYIIKFTLPAGYAVDEMPQSKSFGLAESAARYYYNIAQIGDAITLTSSFHINRNIFSQDQYPNLKEFYNQVVAKQAEQIVLKKK